MSNPTLVRRRLDEILADGEWHAREPIVVELMSLVEPGRAVRAAHRERAADRAKRGSTGPVNPALSRPRDDQRVGARRIVKALIAAAVSRGAIEKREHNDTIELRAPVR